MGAVHLIPLENIPFFVPPGHVLLFWLGLRFAPRLSPAWADRLTLAYLLIAASFALWGLDQFSLLLILAYSVVYWSMPRQRPLLALMFLAATALELYGMRLAPGAGHPSRPCSTSSRPIRHLRRARFTRMLDAVVIHHAFLQYTDARHDQSRQALRAQGQRQTVGRPGIMWVVFQSRRFVRAEKREQKYEG